MRCSVQPTLGGMLSFTTHLSKFLFDRRRGYPFFSWGGGHKGEVCESASNPLRGYLPQHTRSPKPKNPATLLIVPRCVNSSNALSINCTAAPGTEPNNASLTSTSSPSCGCSSSSTSPGSSAPAHPSPNSPPP